jgi:putative peptide zinc metalloprotease protein
MYTRDTVVDVPPFTRQPEGEDVIIGRIETGIFLAVPPEAVELLEQLAQGKNIGEVADQYQRDHGETLDFEDFLSVMEAKGMVRPQREDVSADAPSPRTRSRYHFRNFPQPLARRLFSPPVLAGSFVLIALALAAFIRDPSLVQGWRDLYFPDHRTLNWTILILAGYIALFLHELAHLVAARSLGVNSRMGISNRLWYLVAETDLTGLWSVPKRQRYLPMLAGILLDAASGAVLVLVLAYAQKWLRLSPMSARLLRALAFTYLMRLVWQFCLFVRTDLYYVIANFFNCRNLLSDTKALLRNLLARVLPFVRPVDQSDIPPAEKRIIRVYAVFLVAGRLWALSLLLSVTLPLMVHYAGNLAAAFKVGFSANPADFIDAVLLATYFLAPLVIGFMLWISSFVRRERT